MTSSIQAIIFDFGGVIINWNPHALFNKYFSNDKEAIDRFLAEINFSAWNLAQDEGHPFAKGVMELSEKFPQYAHLIRAYDEEWEESITGVIPETTAILHKLKAAGYRLYGLTNWSAEKFQLVRQILWFPVKSNLSSLIQKFFIWYFRKSTVSQRNVF